MSLVPSNKNNPCPICEDATGKCRQGQEDPDYWQCMLYADARKGEIHNGFKCIGHTRDRLWGQFKLVTSQEWSDQQRLDWQRENQRRQQQKAKADDERRRRSLSAEERHEQYTQLLGELSLHPDDRADLVRRGFTDVQIELCGFKSIERYQRLQSCYSELLPGVSRGDRLIMANAGYLCPVRNIDGLIVACQLRLRTLPTTESSRYRWLSGDGQVLHLFPEGCKSEGELPLAVHFPQHSLKRGIGLCEGTGAKPFLAAQRLGIPFIGAAGGLFASSQRLLEIYLERLNCDRRQEIIIPIDGGDILNNQVLARWHRVVALVQKLGHSVKVAWWGQLTKNHPDIDELASLEAIEFITTKTFWDIVNHTKQQAERDEKLRQERLKLEAEEAIYQSLTTIQEKPWKEVNQELIDLEGLGLEPGAIYIVSSAKGTGKTKGLIPIVGQYDSVLAWFNRIALGREECNRIGLSWKDELSVDKGRKRGFCSDSAPQFAPHILGADGMFLADECDQVFNHNFGDTCNKDGKRPLILATLQAHVDAAIAGGGIALFMSADVAQKEIDYIKALAPEGCPVRVIVNHYKPAKGDLYFDLSPSPDARIEMLLADLEEDVPCFVIDDIKNGVRGCKSIAEYIRTVHPEWASQIIEINSDTSGAPEIIEFLKSINEASKRVRLICCSPSVVSGISIENGRFADGVYGFFNGVLSINEICQAIARVRGANAINIWAAQQGLIYAANRATDPREIKSWYHRNYEANCKHILGFGVEYNPIIGEWNSPHFELYCKNAAYRNLCMEKLRERLYKRLEQEGYMIRAIAPSDSDMVKNGLKQSWSGIELAHAKAIANAKILSDEELKIFQNASKQPTPEEKLDLEKTFLLKSFGQELIDATVFEHEESGEILTGFAAMALKNERGVYRNQLEAFYLLQSDLGEAIAKDLAEERKQEAHGEGRFCGDLRWRTRQRKAREFLGLHQFLDPEKQWEPRHYAELVEKAKGNAGLIKDTLNLSVEKISGGQIFGEFIQQIGLSLQKEWAPTQPGQKRFKLRRIDPESWRYAQMYVQYKESLRHQESQDYVATELPEGVTVESHQVPITPPYISIESQGGGDRNPTAETPDFNTLPAACASSEVAQGSCEEVSLGEANCHIAESQGSTAQSVSIQELGVANDSSDALPLPLPQKPSIEVPNVTEDVSFCLESLSRLETNDITSQAQLIALWGEIERRGQHCDSLLPGDFWVRASSALGVAADALEQKESRVESAVRLLKEAIGHGADTVRAVFARWSSFRRWEAILRLEENSGEDMQRLMQVVPNWAQLMNSRAESELINTPN